MTISEYSTRRPLRHAVEKKYRGRKATMVAAGLMVAVSSAAVTFGGSTDSQEGLLAFSGTVHADGSEAGQLTPQPREITIIPAPITGGDERVVAQMTNEMAASHVGLGRLYEEGEGDVAAGQVAVAEAQNPHNGSLKSLPGNLQMNYPADSTRTSSTFGMRSNPTGAGSQFHVGTDFPVPTGTPVKATEAGTVTFAGVHATGGYRVEIDHGHDVTTAYSHNSQFSVGVGDTVEKGQTVALAGSTGNSTGPHIHYEIQIDGKWVDPQYYLPSQDGGSKQLRTASTAQ